MRQAQDGDVKSATAQVEDGVDARAGVVQSICNRSGGRLVDQAQHIQASQLRRILGGLALRVVKVRGHGDHRAVQVIVQTVLRPVTQRGQDISAHLHRRLLARHGFQCQHARLVDKPVGQSAVVGDVFEIAPHEAFHRADGVLRVLGDAGQRVVPDPAAAIGQVTHDGGKDDPALLVRQAFGRATAHRGHQ